MPRWILRILTAVTASVVWGSVFIACAATDLRTPSCSPSSDQPPARRASCLHALALADQKRNDFASAENRLREALASWTEAGPDFRPSYAISLLNLGELYRLEHRNAESEARLREALDVAGTVRAGYPEIYPAALSRLAGLYAGSDRSQQARVLLNEAIPSFRGLAKPEGSEHARALATLGLLDIVAANYREAESHLSDAIALSSGAAGEDTPETAEYQCNLALAYIQDGQMDRAEPLLNRARFVVETKGSRDDLRLAAVYAEIGLVATNRRKFSIAEDAAKRSIAILERQPVPEPSKVVLARVNLAAVYLRARRLDDAEQILPGLVAEERAMAPRSCLLADGLRELAELRALRHSWREATALYEESLAIYRERLGPDNPGIARLQKTYEEALKHAGKSAPLA
jgi:tetratricopeptide (TPR) repeat protein